MKLKSLINVEFKYHDVQNGHQVTSTGTVINLNLIAQGDTTLTRDGAQFRNKSMEIRFDVTEGVTLGQTTVTRVMLGIYKNVNGVALTPADIVQNLNVRSQRNYDNQKNVIILKEWDMVTSTSQSNNTAYRHHYTEVDLITRYQTAATSGSILGMEQGNLFLFTIGSVVSGGPTFNLETRLRYIDN